MHSPKNDIIQHYAEALIALAEAGDLLARFEKEALLLGDLLRQSEELRRFLHDPGVQGAGKKFALTQLLDTRVHPALVYFVLMLQETGHLALLPEIVDEFYAQLSSLKQKAVGDLVISRPLDPDRLAAIEQEISRIIGKPVTLRVKINPNQLGGLYVRVGNFIIDDTIENRLAKMTRQMVEA
jgi:F-type H+-transporting ATPase subunit delta